MIPVIYTFTGRKLNPLEIGPDDIDIRDLAHALALCNRFAGHTREPIPVAQHSVYAAHLLWGTPSALQGLLHDASEAYLGDVTKWLKMSPTMAGYRDAEDKLQRLIYRAYGCAEEDSPEVKAVDRLLVRYEGMRGFHPGWEVTNMQPGEEVMRNYAPLTPEEIARMDALFGGWRFWDWREAEARFLETYRRLTDGTLSSSDWADVWRGVSYRVQERIAPPERV